MLLPVKLESLSPVVTTFTALLTLAEKEYRCYYERWLVLQHIGHLHY